MAARLPAASAWLLLLLTGVAPASEQIENRRLMLQIEQLISRQPALRIFDWVQFALHSDEVVLTGAVTQPALKPSIERSVLALEGVRFVRNGIEVLPSSGDDIGIRINARWRIYGHPEIRRYIARESSFRPKLRRAAGDIYRVLLRPIHIVVRDGHLTLEGELEQRREKHVAERQAYAVLGVRSVTNNIVVTGADTEEFEPIDFEADPWWLDADSVTEPVLRVENPAGGVRVRVANIERVRLRRSSRGRALQASDTNTTRLGKKMRIRTQPSDGAWIDLIIDLPYGHRLEVETADGPITLEGLVRGARLKTAVGTVELAVPWRSVRLEVVSDHRPRTVAIPPQLGASFLAAAPDSERVAWTLHDARDLRERLYGSIRLDAVRPDSLVLRDADIPGDSPVRMHWQAPEVLKSMLRRPFRMRLRRPGQRARGPTFAFSEAPPGVAQFNSDVRLVQLSATVVDAANRPVTGLGSQHFEILEDGVEQHIGLVHDSEKEFNLVLLLDCSTSTLADRKAVLEAARQFTLTARASDRVGIYVLSDSYLRVVSPLTAERGTLLQKIGRIPRLSGGTPLYDAITLAYAQELARRRWERNALIVISDGMDNDLLPQWRRSIPSRVAFDDLLRVAAEMNSAIYPIFLEPQEPGVRTERSWRERWRRSTDRARERMRKLAAATGGRLFRSGSIGDLDAVYEQIADELRSVYTLGYYPSNQEFDGAWRRIRVNLRNIEALVRTRPGYYAW